MKGILESLKKLRMMELVKVSKVKIVNTSFTQQCVHLGENTFIHCSSLKFNQRVTINFGQ